MPRTLWIATLVILIAGCKTSDAPAPAANAAPAAPLTRSIAPAPQPALPAPPPPAPATPATRDPAKTAPVGSNTELETRGLAAMQRMADLFAADARDCDKLGTDLKAFVVENQPLIAELLKHEDHQSAEQRAAFTRRNAVTQAAIAQKMQAALTACASNASVLAAMKQFPGE